MPVLPVLQTRDEKEASVGQPVAEHLVKMMREKFPEKKDELEKELKKTVKYLPSDDIQTLLKYLTEEKWENLLYLNLILTHFNAHKTLKEFQSVVVKFAEVLMAKVKGTSFFAVCNELNKAGALSTDILSSLLETEALWVENYMSEVAYNLRQLKAGFQLNGCSPSINLKAYLPIFLLYPAESYGLQEAIMNAYALISPVKNVIENEHFHYFVIHHFIVEKKSIYELQERFQENIKEREKAQKDLDARSLTQPTYYRRPIF